MRLLLDTNVFLEVLLEQEAAGEARAVIENAGQHELFISDYSLHSIGLLLFRRAQHELFTGFVNDLIEAAVTHVCLDPADMSLVVEAARQFSLDFDDAYQYAAAERHDLTIVSFDRDFDRTTRGRKTPGQI